MTPMIWPKNMIDHLVYWLSLMMLVLSQFQNRFQNCQTPSGSWSFDDGICWIFLKTKPLPEFGSVYVCPYDVPRPATSSSPFAMPRLNFRSISGRFCNEILLKEFKLLTDTFDTFTCWCCIFDNAPFLLR